MSSSYRFTHRHILGLEDFSHDDLEFALNTAESLSEISSRSIKKVPTLRGCTVVNLFFEPSTRTRLSFEIAAKRMSADTYNISASTSSATKGETLIDTARNINAMHADAIVIRHSFSGAPHLLARHVAASVINAGDGTHEHPSQALLDLLTVRQHKGRIAGLKIAILGDILHSRVAHSNIIGFARMGASVYVGGPATMLPSGLRELGAVPCRRVEEAVEDADVVMTLRIQLERQRDPLLPSLREYASVYGLDQKLFARARADALIMHPGPINRGVELMSDLADGDHSVILDQVSNGVAVRMALLYLLLGNRPGRTDTDSGRT
ncbi:MAG: aspartate carbamoyltransferase [Desulfobulbaceae bacterium A2]|nr:MAG: aspartate carbamoyltransferase [Desulfobulbaceae bacterium A2]